jgi:hypothetical protein
LSDDYRPKHAAPRTPNLDLYEKVIAKAGRLVEDGKAAFVNRVLEDYGAERVADLRNNETALRGFLIRLERNKFWQRFIDAWRRR